MLSDILDPFDKLEGGTNLATMFASSTTATRDDRFDTHVLGP